MSEELQSLVQIIELYGRGLGGLGKAIRFSAKTAEKGVELAKVKNMQHKLKLHYASTGEHKTLKLKELEKLTGGQYNILNIPIENEKELTDFYDRLKKIHVSFAELPDLQMGDGYTQIAYNPMDAENVRLVVQYYRKKWPEEARDIDLDEYINMAGKDGEELLDELAKKGYTNEMHVEQLAEIQEKIRNGEGIPISINLESLLIKEEKDTYTVRIPTGRTKSIIDHAMVIKKSDVILMDQGQTIITYVNKDDIIPQYQMDSHENVIKDRPLSMKAEKFVKAFQPVGQDRLKDIQKLKPNQVEIFPSFNQGQETERESLAPDAVSERKLSEGEQTMGKVISMEKLKERQSNPEYIPLTFDMEKQFVAENKNVYTASLPKSPEEDLDKMRCLVIDKSDTHLSEDGKRLSAYIKKSATSRVLEFDRSGHKIGEYQMKNEEIALAYLKESRTLGKGRLHNYKELQNGLAKNGFQPVTRKKVKS